MGNELTRRSRRKPRLPVFGEPIDDASVQRIVSAMKQYGALPEIDIWRLRNDLNELLVDFAITVDLGSDVRWRNRHEKLKRIHTDASRLLQDLDLEEGGTWLTQRFEKFFENSAAGQVRNSETDVAPGYPTFHQIISGLRRLAEVASVQVEWQPKDAPFKIEGGPFAWVVRQPMADIFEKYFHRKPTFTRDPREKGGTSEPRGAFIDFVKLSFSELRIRQPNGDEYKAESIASALAKFRTPMTRRNALGKKKASP
jgi:hypothetical protein